ncbi:serine hydrolase [Winogradskyella sp.]|uniref:serine hydrolase domain-containing protein n=1 Tax=Winogradskyella sp. TaxID=1883156 RepID=UPI0026313295|nr:serine hydrolase [Winogradskyella sp.]
MNLFYRGLCVLFLTLAFNPSLFAQNDDYLNPKMTDDGIVVGNSRQHIDTLLIANLISEIESGSYKNIHSVLVLKDNKLLVEKYFDGYDINQLHQLRSISKCVTGLLLGIAIDKGYIKSVEEGIFNYLPNYQHLKNENNAKIKIHHLASMSTGLDWNETNIPYEDKNNDDNKMYNYGDWVEYTLKKEVVATPGEVFNYSGGVSNILAAVVQNAVGIPLELFAEQHLFNPLGIQNYNWKKNRTQTLVSADAGLSIRPRDMIKIGTMLLNKGEWGDKRILSEKWVKRLSSKQVNGGAMGPFLLSYGYMVLVVEKGPDFLPGLRGYAATGNGGQIIWVLPEQNAVFVFTGGNYNSELSQTQPIEIAIKYLFPAVKD